MICWHTKRQKNAVQGWDGVEVIKVPLFAITLNLARLVAFHQQARADGAFVCCFISHGAGGVFAGRGFTGVFGFRYFAPTAGSATKNEEADYKE